MAIAFDSASSAQDSGVSSKTWSHTCSGTDRVLDVIVATSSGAGATTVSSVTFDGVSLSSVGTQLNPFSDYRLTVYRLIAPNATTANIVVTLAASQPEVTVFGVSFSGADQTTPGGTAVFAQATSGAPSAAVTSVASDEIVYAVGTGANWTAITDGGGQSARTEQENVGGWSSAALSTKTGTGTVTLSWTPTTGGSGTTQWQTVGIAMKPSAGGGGSSIARQMMQYHG